MRITIPTLILFFSCSTTKLAETKHKLTFGTFSIEVPRSWQKVEVQGIDSQVGRIAIDKRDTVEFDLGFYSNSLVEDEPDDFQGSDYSKYRKTTDSWQIIDNYTAKVVTPKKAGTGLTGVYIDSIWKENSGIVKFNLYGVNLSKSNQKSFLEAVKTLKFNQLK